MSNDEIFNIFNEFMETHDLYPHVIEEFPSYTIDRMGVVRDKNGDIVKPYHYDNQYDSVYLKDGDKYGKRDIHRLVAQTFDSEFTKGCVVHHINENKYYNTSWNLQCLSKKEHARHHADPSALIKYTAENGSPIKGKKMSDEFRENCKRTAKLRYDSGVYDDTSFGKGFHGNQYVDKDGNPLNK